MADYREDKIGGQENGDERNISRLFFAEAINSPLAIKTLELPSTCILSSSLVKYPLIMCRLVEKGHQQHLINQSTL